MKTYRKTSSNAGQTLGKTHRPPPGMTQILSTLTRPTTRIYTHDDTLVPESSQPCMQAPSFPYSAPEHRGPIGFLVRNPNVLCVVYNFTSPSAAVEAQRQMIVTYNYNSRLGTGARRVHACPQDRCRRWQGLINSLWRLTDRSLVIMWGVISHLTLTSKYTYIAFDSTRDNDHKGLRVLNRFSLWTDKRNGVILKIA